MTGQIIVDDQDVPPLLHEVLSHAGGGIGSNEIVAWRILAGGHNDDAVIHGPIISQIGDNPGQSRPLLANGTIDAQDPFIDLVDHGVQGDGRLSDLPVAQDQLPLTSADGELPKKLWMHTKQPNRPKLGRIWLHL